MRYRISAWLAALVLALPVWLPAQAHGGVAVSRTASPEWPAPSPAAQEFASRIVQLADHGQLPFVVVDKQAAMVMVYRPDGVLAGVSTVLLGLTPGDRSVVGVGERTQAGRLTVADRTTPAGRFQSSPGRNLSGEHVVWINYADALAIHRLRPGPRGEKRVQRMASMHPGDKRISAGCVVVPELFYDGVIRPVLGSGSAVVYVMPENSDWQAAWNPVAAPQL